MKQVSKNIILSGLLFLLTGITTWVYFTGVDNKLLDVDENMFTLELNTVITTVILEGPVEKNQFEYINNQWVVNEKFNMDRGMRDVFFAVLSSVKIQRKVPENIQDSVASIIKAEGIKVNIYDQGIEVNSYKVSGDEQKGITYFQDVNSSVVYYMNIPGYKSYIAGIYSVPENDWRDRFIFDFDFTNLEKLTAEYSNQPEDNLILKFEENEYRVNGKIPGDSAVVLDYIEAISNLQTITYFNKGSNQKYDSIIDLAPYMKFSVEAIGKTNQELSIYGYNFSGRTLGKLNEETIVLIEERSLRTLFVSESSLLNEGDEAAND